MSKNGKPSPAQKGTIFGNRQKTQATPKPPAKQKKAVTAPPEPEQTHYHSEPIERHAEKPQDELVSKSYTIYRSDDELLTTMIPQIGEYTRAKVKKSTLIRLAIKYLNERIQSGGKGFDADIERLLKDCL